MTDEPLHIQVELLSDRGEIERVVALAATIPIARGAYQAAVENYGARYCVRVRDRARIVEKRDRPGHEKADDSRSR